MPSLFCVCFILILFLKLIVTCRLWVINVREENYSNVKVVIRWLMWITWTLLSTVWERPLNLITHSLFIHTGTRSWDSVDLSWISPRHGGHLIRHEETITTWKHGVSEERQIGLLTVYVLNCFEQPLPVFFNSLWPSGDIELGQHWFR